MSESRDPPEPLRILIVAADPIDHPQAELARELGIVEHELRGHDDAGRVRIDSAFSVTPELLARLLDTYRPHLLHYAGHGNARGEPYLLTDDDTGQPVPLRGVHGMLARTRSLRCVVFNACSSARLAQELAVTLPIVAVGHRAAVEDSSLRLFAEQFYRGLALGRSVRAAVDTARTMLASKGLAAADLPQINAHPNIRPGDVVLLPAASIAAPAHDHYAAADLAALEAMLLSMFSTGEFVRLLRHHDDTHALTHELPDGPVAPARLFADAVETLAHHAVLGPALFARITEARPNRAREIEAVAARFSRRS